MKSGLTAIAATWKTVEVKPEFAGSDAIAAAIRAGRRPDLIIAANSKIPAALEASGLVEGRLAIAGNRVVIAVPSGSSKINSLADLAAPGVKIALGSKSVPIGSYADKLLSRLPASQREAILSNVRTREPDAGGVVGKLRSGAVDAAILYETDVTASQGALRAVAVADAIAPKVVYEAAIVKGAKHPGQARDLIAFLRGPAGQRVLEQSGYLPSGG
jgi:molybdate transport system substrate-binding protein